MMRKRNYHTFPSGFTIVELLVVISIMTLLFSIGYGRFRDFSRRQALASVARQIEGDIRLTQELASSGKKPDRCVTLSVYRFRVNNNDTYNINAECTEWDDDNDSDKYFKYRVAIPHGFSLSAPDGRNINFYTVGGGNDAGDGYSVDIEDATGDTLTVSVTSGGDVNIGN